MNEKDFEQVRQFQAEEAKLRKKLEMLPADAKIEFTIPTKLNRGGAKMTETELNNIRYLEIEIEKLKKKLSTMPCDKGLGEMNVDGMPHASGNADKVSQLAIERAEILTEYENALKTRSNEFKRAFEFISNIPDSETRLIFFDRFLEGMTYEQIGNDLFMDAKTVFRRIKNYLSEQ